MEQKAAEQMPTAKEIVDEMRRPGSQRRLTWDLLRTYAKHLGISGISYIGTKVE